MKMIRFFSPPCPSDELYNDAIMLFPQKKQKKTTKKNNTIQTFPLIFFSQVFFISYIFTYFVFWGWVWELSTWLQFAIWEARWQFNQHSRPLITRSNNKARAHKVDYLCTWPYWCLPMSFLTWLHFADSLQHTSSHCRVHDKCTLYFFFFQRCNHGKHSSVLWWTVFVRIKGKVLA